MINQPMKPGQPTEDFPVWTYEQAEQAIPYIQSVLSSIRERFLEVQSKRRYASVLKKKPGRPDRQSIIQYEDAKRDADRVQLLVADAAQELADLNIHCVDPINGVAMIPFVRNDQLAWMVFELFEPNKITKWRYHHDPLDVRRPMDEKEPANLDGTLIA